MSELEHTMESVFGTDSTIEVDPYAGKPETMSEAAWDNLTPEIKDLYSNPNSEMNKAIQRVDAKEQTHTMESVFGYDTTEDTSMTYENLEQEDSKRIQQAITDYEVDPSTLFFTTQAGLQVRGGLEDAQGYVRTEDDIIELDREIKEAAPEGTVEFLEQPRPEKTGFEDALEGVSEEVKTLLDVTLMRDEETITKYLEDKNMSSATLTKWLSRPNVSIGMGLGFAMAKQVETMQTAPVEEVMKNLMYSEDEYIALAKAVDAKLTNENNVRSGLSKMLIDSGMDIHQIAWLTGVAEFAPGTGFAIGVREIPIHARESFKALANGEPWNAAKHGAFAGVETLAAMASTFPAIRVAWDQSIKGLYRMSGMRADKIMNTINANTIAKTKVTAAAARKARLENKEVNDRLILEYEAKVSKSQGREIKISKQATDKDGKPLGYLVIDPKLVRAEGLATTKNMKTFQQERMDAFTKARYAPLAQSGQGTADFQGNIADILNNRTMQVEDTKEWKRLKELEKQGQNVTPGLVELRKAWNESDINIIYGASGEDYLNPLLDSEKFDAIIAVASEMVKRNPNEFGKLSKGSLKIKKGKIVKTTEPQMQFKVDPDNTLIDQLFDYSVANKLDGYNSEFTDILSKYGLTFDDYVLAVVGSGSEAGKILNRLSQLKRTKNFDILKNMEGSFERQSGNFGMTAQKLDNIRRGLMVSRIQTTMRNMRSALLRSPIVAMDNVFQGMLMRYSEDGLGGALKAISPIHKDGTWKGAFRGLYYMLQEPSLAKSISEFTLDDKRMGGFDTLIRNANEIRTMSGKADNETSATIKKLGQLSDILNVPNRLQDRWVAEATFTGEMERLINLLWRNKETGEAVDYLAELQKGNIDDFLSNSSRLRPEGALTFEEITKQAMDRSLDLTYRLGPRTDLLKSVNQAVQKFGIVGSAFIPFPKFLFGSMEMMADHTTQGVKTLIMRAVNRGRGIETNDAASAMQILQGGKKVKRGEYQPLTLRQSEQISRNLTGIATIVSYAAYRRGYFTGGDVNADFKLVNNTKEIEANQEYSTDAPMFNRLQGRLIYDNVQFGNAPAGTKEIIKITTDINKDAIVHVRNELGEVFKLSTESPNFKKLEAEGFTVEGAVGVGVEDITPVFPAAQFMWLAELGNRIIDGTVDQWYPDGKTLFKEAVKTFTGSNFRTGVGGHILDDIFNAVALAQSEDAIKQGKGMEAFLEWFGGYVGTNVVILSQVADAQMMMGLRDTEAKYVRNKQDIGSALSKWEAFIGPMRSQGITTLLPESVGDAWNTGVDKLMTVMKNRNLLEEETSEFVKDLFDADGVTIRAWNDYPAKQYLYGGGDKVNIWRKFLGYTEKTKESDEGEWLTRRGFIACKSGLKTDKVNRDIREKVHEHFRKNYLKEIVELGKELEEEALIEWSDPNSTMATNYNKAEDWLQASTAEQVHQLLRNGIILSKNEVLSDMDIEDSDLFKLQERMRKLGKRAIKELTTRYIRRYNKVFDVNNLDDMEDLLGTVKYDPLTRKTYDGVYVGGILQELQQDTKELKKIQEGASIFD